MLIQMLILLLGHTDLRATWEHTWIKYHSLGIALGTSWHLSEGGHFNPGAGRRARDV